MILSPILNRLCKKALLLTCLALYAVWHLCQPTSFASAQVEFKPNTEQEEKAVEEHSDSEDPQAKKAAKAANFTRYAPGLRVVCAHLDEDGRREAMFKMLEPLHKEVPDCAGCNSLLRSFASACKAARAKLPKKKVERPKVKVDEAAEESAAEVSADHEQHEDGEAGEEAAPTPTPVPARRLQREPSTKLLDAFSTMLIQMAEDERRSTDAARAMQLLVDAMKYPHDKTPGEKEYFEILSAYVYAPFASILERKEDNPAAKHEGPAAPKPPVDDLFSF